MRIFAALSVLIYAVMLTVGSYFVIVEVDSEMKWLLLALVLVACMYSWFSARSIFSGSYTKGGVELNLRHLLLVSLVTLTIREEPQAIYYVGVPTLFLAIGVFFLYVIGRRSAS